MSDYSKREIDLIVTGIKQHIDDKDHNHEETLKKILTQTTKTNGRVNRLENWRAYLVGAWAVVSFIVIPGLAYIYTQEKTDLQNQIINNQEEIKDLLDNE